MCSEAFRSGRATGAEWSERVEADGTVGVRCGMRSTCEAELGGPGQGRSVGLADDKAALFEGEEDLGEAGVVDTQVLAEGGA